MDNVNLIYIAAVIGFLPLLLVSPFNYLETWFNKLHKNTFCHCIQWVTDQEKGVYLETGKCCVCLLFSVLRKNITSKGPFYTRLYLTLLHPISHVSCMYHILNIHALKIRHCLTRKYYTLCMSSQSWPLLNIVMTLLSLLICYLLHCMISKYLFHPFMISDSIFRAEIPSSKISANYLKILELILLRPHCVTAAWWRQSNELLNYQFQYRPLFTFKRSW